MLTACDNNRTTRDEIPTPATPVMIGNRAAHTDRNTSSRIKSAARTPITSLAPAPPTLVNAVSPVSTLSCALLASLARASASPACLVELKMTVAYAVCPFLLISSAPDAVNGLMTFATPGTWATSSNIGMILDRADEETAASLGECQTMMPGVADAALFPAFAKRAYAVAESDAGSRSELLNAVPATPRTPPSTTSKAIHPPMMALRLRVQN